MMTPVRKGNVPASTPAADQPMPLSRLETATATPKPPVRTAVDISRTRRDIIEGSSRSSRETTRVARHPIGWSLDQPTLFARHLLHMLEILLDEAIERGTG